MEIEPPQKTVEHEQPPPEDEQLFDDVHSNRGDKKGANVGQQKAKVDSNAKKRHRPRTKALRNRLKTLLESALLNAPADVMDKLFSPLEDGTLAAPIPGIFSALGLPEEGAKFMAQLSVHALKSVSNISRVFRIADPPQQNQQKPEEAAAAALWLIVQPSKCAHREERTVYVDNLPAQCTKAKLERRCAQFGTVIGVHLPQIGRIQRRISHLIGGQPAPHSGFAFIQFASKTAAKRFCKRYAANSRLKRTHHGHRQHVKKGKQQQQQHGGGEMVMAGMEGGSHNQSAELMPTGSSPPPPPCFIAPSAPPPSSLNTNTASSTTTIVTTTMMDTNEASTSGDVVRVRSYSVAESTMSVDESGRETDAEDSKAVEGGGEGNAKAKKKKRNRRKRRSAAATAATMPMSRGQSLNSIFRQIQVFPLRQYKELRASYLALKKASMVELKKQLRENAKEKSAEKEAGLGEMGQNIVTTRRQEKNHSAEKRAAANKKRKRRRERGIRRLMDRAEKAKMASLNAETQQSR